MAQGAKQPVLKCVFRFLRRAQHAQGSSIEPRHVRSEEGAKSFPVAVQCQMKQAVLANCVAICVEVQGLLPEQALPLLLYATNCCCTCDSICSCWHVGGIQPVRRPRVVSSPTSAPPLSLTNVSFEVSGLWSIVTRSPNSICLVASRFESGNTRWRS